MSTYLFLPVVGGILLIYATSYLLTKITKLKFTKHRRIWNLLLLVSFLVAGALGFIMAFIYSFELDFEIPYFMLQLHVMFGLVWFVIAFFHFMWHLTYFKKAIKVIFKRGR